MKVLSGKCVLYVGRVRLLDQMKLSTWGEKGVRSMNYDFL